MARSVCDNAYVTKSGYRIVAITRACQARDRGSTPLTRSGLENEAHKSLVFISQENAVELNKVYTRINIYINY